MSNLRATAKAHPRIAALALFVLLAVPFAAFGVGEIINKPFVQGVLTFRGNAEQIDNNTDDMIEFQGTGGTDNTDLRVDLDGTWPVLDSPTDTSLEIAEALIIGGAITLANSETIDNANDDFIEFQGAAGADNTDIRVDLDGTHPIFDSPTDTQIAFAEDTIGFGATNGETLVMSTDDTFDFTRDDAGAVTLTCSDNDVICAMIYDAGGAAQITIGSADVTQVVFTVDGTTDDDFQAPGTSIGAAEVVLDTLTYAQWSDSSAIDASTTFTAADGIGLTYTISHMAGDENFLAFNAAQLDDANATDDLDVIRLALSSESGDAGDTFEGIVGTWANGAANAVLDSFISFDNMETTAATVTDAIIITSSGVDGGIVDGLDVSAANITNAVNVGVNRVAGGNSDFFQAGATDATFLYTRDTAGEVVFQGADDAGAADTRFDTTGAGAVFLGSADVTSVTVTTDATGDGSDFEVPASSIESDEILDGAIVAADLADTLCLQVFSVTFNPTEAGATNDFVALTSIDVATGDARFSATEGDQDDFRVPVAVTADNLAVVVDVAPGAGNDDWKVTLRDDGASSTLTCTIDEGATTCADAVAPVAVAALSRLNVLVDSSGGGADPTAAAEMTISFCLGQ